jgi:hypothetical protein
MTKTEIRKLIEEGQLRPAVQAALEYAKKCQLEELDKDLTVLSGNLENHQKQWNTQTISYDEFLRGHARIAHGLTELLDQLPNTPTPGSQVRVLDEHKYKWRVFWIFIVAKLLVVSRLYYHWDRGGFTWAEFVSTLFLLVAALVAHSVVMFDNLLQHDREGFTNRRYVSRMLARAVQALILLYAVTLFVAVEWKAMSTLSFPEMNTMITLSETLLGGLIGKVVQRFFKSEK